MLEGSSEKKNASATAEKQKKNKNTLFPNDIKLA